MIYPHVSKSQVVTEMFSRHHGAWVNPNSRQVAYYQYVESGRNADDEFSRFGKYQSHVSGLMAKKTEKVTTSLIGHVLCDPGIRLRRRQGVCPECG